MSGLDFPNMPAMVNRCDKPDTTSGNTDSQQSPNLGLGGFDGEASLFKAARSSSGVCAASARHIKTEQKRRDRINEGFVALQALLPGKEKVEKAVMLTQAADYIRQLQNLMQQVLSCGAAKALPNELQWNLRMLLPRKNDLLTTPVADSNTNSANTAAGQVPANNCNGTGSPPSGPVASQGHGPVVQEPIRPVVAAPTPQPPSQCGLQFSGPQVAHAPQQTSLGINIPQGQVTLSEPAAGGPGGMNQAGMLIADPHTLSQLQALVQQQQAVQGWHNTANLLQALHMSQQLQQQQNAATSMGVTVTPQMLQQLAAAQSPGIQAMYQGPNAATVSVGVPVASNGLPVSSINTSMIQPPSAPPQAPTAPLQAPQAVSAYPQPPQPTSTFTPAATSAFSSLGVPTSSSAFTPAGSGSGSLSGLHQLMEAANASDEEKEGVGFEMRSAKRARCYAAGPPRVAKAGILV